MNVRDIIIKHLNDTGCDGIFYPGECGCLKSDLAPCNSDNIDTCESGYKVMCAEHGRREECECGLDTPDPIECWCIMREKPAEFGVKHVNGIDTSTGRVENSPEN